MAQGRIRGILDGLATVCVIAASLAVIWSVVGGRRPLVGRASTTPNAANLIQDLDGKKLRLPLSPLRRLDPSNGRLALVEFSDFQCPFSGKYARETLPTLKREFIDTRQVSYVFMNFPIENIHPHALGAAKAATCAGKQGQFWEMHQRLFANQSALGSDSLVDQARMLRLDEPSFTECVNVATVDIRSEIVQARQLGVTSTPTFFLGELADDGRAIVVRRGVKGAVPYDVFKTAIQSLSSPARAQS